MPGMNRNKSSCLQLTTAQTRIAKGIKLRERGLDLPRRRFPKAAVVLSTWAGAGEVAHQRGAQRKKEIAAWRGL